MPSVSTLDVGIRRAARALAGALALGLVLATGACTPLDDAMVAIFGRSMRDQTSFDPYEAPLPAPEGSVAFSAGNFPARPGEVNVGQPEGLEDFPAPFTQLELINEAPVVVGLANPVALNEASAARGEELYLRFCAPCHGPNGAGVTGYIIPAGYPPFPLVTDRVRGFTDGYIYGMIRVGRGLMPAYGHRIHHFDRWHIVNYLRVLQGVAPPTSSEASQVGAGGGEGPGGGPAPSTGGTSSQGGL